MNKKYAKRMSNEYIETTIFRSHRNKLLEASNRKTLPEINRKEDDPRNNGSKSVVKE